MNNLLDELAFEIDDNFYYDQDLKKILSFNPYHNMYMMGDKVNELGREYFFNPDREIIETDRSGWRGYGKIYSQYFTKLRDKPINLLEIGIERGYGLLAWRRYFKNAKIYGIEIYGNKFFEQYLEIKKQFPDLYNKIEMHLNFDSSEQKNWYKSFKDIKFDIIIDDGSHDASIQLKTLKNSFDFLNKNGFYFIEDIKTFGRHTNKTRTDSFTETNKLAIELINLFTLKKIKNIFFYKHINQERQTNNAFNLNPYDYSVSFQKN